LSKCMPALSMLAVRDWGKAQLLWSSCLFADLNKLQSYEQFAVLSEPKN
jgi:hypothetical protein